MRFLAVSLLLVVLASSAESTVGSPLDVSLLTAKADTIVLGTAHLPRTIDRSVRMLDGNEVSGTTELLSVTIAQVIKGEPAAAIVIKHFKPSAPIGWRGIPTGRTRLFFLSHLGNEYVPVDDRYQSLPAAVVLRRSVAPEQMAAIAILEAVFSGAPGEAQEAIWALRGEGSTLVQSELAKGLQAHKLETPVRLSILAELIRRGDLTALRAAVPVLLSDSYPRENRLDLSYSINRISDPKSVTVLRSLIAAPLPETRRAAALALRNSGSAEALPALCRLLADSDLESRYFAVIGLAEIVGQKEWRPLEEDFKSSEDKYLQHWHKWADDNSCR